MNADDMQESQLGEALAAMTSELAMDIGGYIRQARGARSQDWLSAKASVSRQIISKIENGKMKRIEITTLCALLEALDLKPSNLFESLSNKNNEAVAIEAVGRTTELAKSATNIDLLIKYIVSLPKETQVLFTADRCPFDDDGVRQIASVTGAALEAQYGVTGGAAISDIATAIHGRLLLWLNAPESYSDSVLNALEIFCGELCTWIGWIAVDAGDHQLAQTYLQEAVLHARVAQSPVAEVCALNNLGVLYVRANVPRRAKKAIEGALRLSADIPARLTALLHLRGVVACGYLQDEAEFQRHVTAARRAFDRGPDADEPLWFRSFSAAEVTGLVGWGYLHLGQPKAAVSAFETVVSKIDSPRARAHYNIQLGRAFAAQGAYADAAQYGLLALPELRNLRSQPVRNDFNSLLSCLSGQRDREAQRFLEACRSVA